MDGCAICDAPAICRYFDLIPPGNRLRRLSLLMLASGSFGNYFDRIRPLLGERSPSGRLPEDTLLIEALKTLYTLDLRILKAYHSLYPDLDHILRSLSTDVPSFHGAYDPRLIIRDLRKDQHKTQRAIQSHLDYIETHKNTTPDNPLHAMLRDGFTHALTCLIWKFDRLQNRQISIARAHLKELNTFSNWSIAFLSMKNSNPLDGDNFARQHNEFSSWLRAVSAEPHFSELHGAIPMIKEYPLLHRYHLFYKRVIELSAGAISFIHIMQDLNDEAFPVSGHFTDLYSMFRAANIVPIVQLSNELIINSHREIEQSFGPDNACAN